MPTGPFGEHFLNCGPPSKVTAAGVKFTRSSTHPEITVAATEWKRRRLVGEATACGTLKAGVLLCMVGSEGTDLLQCSLAPSDDRERNGLAVGRGKVEVTRNLQIMGDINPRCGGKSL